MTEYGGFILKTILNEGQCSKPRQSVIFDKQTHKHGYVVIDLNSANTFQKTSGLPVGERITEQQGNLIVGKILDVPAMATLHYDSSVLGWEDQLENSHYRTANVIWYGINSIVKAHLYAGETSPGNAGLVSDSHQTQKRTDGKLALRPGEGSHPVS